MKALSFYIQKLRFEEDRDIDKARSNKGEQPI